MKSKTAIAALAASLAMCSLASNQASADAVTFTFAGETTGNFFGTDIPIGTPFSGSINYDTTVLGIQNSLFSYYTDYFGAITSSAFTIGSAQYFGSGGYIVVGNDAPGGVDVIFFRVARRTLAEQRRLVLLRRSISRRHEIVLDGEQVPFGTTRGRLNCRTVSQETLP
jgi:hypothetical protein